MEDPPAQILAVLSDRMERRDAKKGGLFARPSRLCRVALGQDERVTQDIQGDDEVIADDRDVLDVDVDVS